VAFDGDGTTYNQVSLFDTGLFPEENTFKQAVDA